MLVGEITERYWKELKRQAERRGIQFYLEPEQAWALFLRQDRRCAITRVPIDFDSRGYRGAASLDRLDCDGPYVWHNVQWTLAPINLMRGSRNLKAFRRLCELVVFADLSA